MTAAMELLEQYMAEQRAEVDALFAEFDKIPFLTRKQFEAWRWRVGRANVPALLHDAWYGRKISRATLTASIGSVWSLAEYPDRNLDHDLWRDLFDEAGFTVDGRRTPKPDRPVEVWRGSVPERRTDWSWTTDRQVAEKFAEGVRGRKPGRLYRLMAPPWSLLCANSERGESEYVIDTDCLGGSLIEEVAR